MALSTCASPTSIASTLTCEILVIAQLEFRQHFEHRAEFQRLAFLEFDFVHFRARDGNEFLLVERLFEIFRHERLHHFALNVVGETAAHQCHGRLAGTESGDAGDRAISRATFSVAF